ncbi:hypothetical protein HanOQP8_Chr06g0227481 [Helianthus annuus]|nr:hypothetical protein HanHA89_Chr06g0235091 [Helianthus annuus]KAJ0738501.1 hypothetical protein HanLR1_Chr06g0219011 [Helianthus annuus]KAJ0741386.1 hypothetical protein HanOQP8_Chr06g0227481 [Helianthus annuus]
MLNKYILWLTGFLAGHCYYRSPVRFYLIAVWISFFFFVPFMYCLGLRGWFSLAWRRWKSPICFLQALFLVFEYTISSHLNLALHKSKSARFFFFI